ncbi:MAG: helix-turn-helix domain-containing protein [Candidatus Woesearchaeota archaeon]|nr:helix-turn-helix domain-containing protein [Candidatus Woesearchaeota archaeon]
MDPGKILEGLFDKKTLTILRQLSADPSRQWYLRELSKSTRVPVASVYRIVNKLVALRIVERVMLKKFKVYHYSTSKEAAFVEQIIAIQKGAVEEFVEYCRAIPAVQQVILHGRKEKSKANLLVIGENIPTGPLVEAAATIKETYEFTAIYIVLEPAQYEQMAAMGLYAGDTQVLLQK